MLLPSFNRPGWLWPIVPLCVIVWWVSRRGGGWRPGGGGTRPSVHLALRCLVVTLICTALAEPHIRWKGDGVAVVAVVDVSDSVPLQQRQLAGEFINGSLTKRPAGDSFGLVTVARNAVVQALPSSREGRVDTGAGGPGDASNLQRGVELAKGLLPSDAGGRVLLISDGNETVGSLANVAATLATTGVPIDVASVDYDRSAMVKVEDVGVPAWARDGDTITARLVMSAGKPTTGRLSILLNGQPVDLDPDSPSLSTRVSLEAGRQALTQLLKLPRGPVHRVEAVFEPDDAQASIPQLLRAEGVTFTNDRGRVLMLAEDPSAAAPLVKAVSSDNLNVEVRPAMSAPTSLTEWSGYDAVVLFDQPAQNLSQAQHADLLRYVHDVGGGLLVVGGPNSYGAGGWIGSPLADALPVVLDPPQKRQMPMGALALIIDRSGSMGAPVAGTGMNQQQIANESAVLGVKALSRLDQVAVVAFSGGTEVVVPLTTCSDPDAIARSIRSIGPDGGTVLFPAIDAAAAELAKSPAGVKHIIILTDGETAGDPQEGFAKARELRAKNITISTVAIGDGSNSRLLRRIAELGGGRAYDVDANNSQGMLTQIFIKEAQTIRRALIWEGPAFSPSVGTLSDSLRGISGALPAVTGYVVTADRGGLSTVSLRGPEGDPILAQWQHGLGRVTAYTSDAATRWNSAWGSWGSFRPFWEQQLKWVLRPSGDTAARVAIDGRGERARVGLELFEPSGERVNFASIRARVTSPVSAGGARDVTFEQTGPGRYEAEIDAAAVGTHLLSLQYEAGQNEAGEPRRGTVRAAYVRRSGEEFRRPLPDTALLQDLVRRTGGRIYHLDPSGVDLWVRERLTMPEMNRPVWLLVAMAAIAVFLLDAAARRVAVDPARVQARLAGLFAAAPQAATASTAAFATAKARAGAKMEQRAATHRADTPCAESMFEAAETAAPVTVRETREIVESAATAPVITNVPLDASSTESDDAMSRLRAAKKRSLPGNDSGRPLK